MSKYKDFEEAIEKSELVGIVAYSAFLLNTLLTSGIFGIPRYSVESNPRIPQNLPLPLKIIFRIVLFFLEAIWGFFAYAFYYMWCILNRDIESLKNIATTREKEYNSAKNCLNMILFAAWTIFLVRTVWKYQAFIEYVEDEPTENQN